MKWCFAAMICGISLLEKEVAFAVPVSRPPKRFPQEAGSLRRVKVVFLLGADCPISQQYMPFLRTVRDRWQPLGLRSVSIFFCNPASQKNRLLAKQFMSELGVHIPWKTDSGNRYAHQMGATVVPSVLVLQSGRLVYSGAIDDLFAGLGQRRALPTEHYLADALFACQAGRMPSPARRMAYGCLIE